MLYKSESKQVRNNKSCRSIYIYIRLKIRYFMWWLCDLYVTSRAYTFIYIFSWFIWFTCDRFYTWNKDWNVEESNKEWYGYPWDNRLEQKMRKGPNQAQTKPRSHQTPNPYLKQLNHDQWPPVVHQFEPLKPLLWSEIIERDSSRQ